MAANIDWLASSLSQGADLSTSADFTVFDTAAGGVPRADNGHVSNHHTIGTMTIDYSAVGGPAYCIHKTALDSVNMDVWTYSMPDKSSTITQRNQNGPIARLNTMNPSVEGDISCYISVLMDEQASGLDATATDDTWITKLIRVNAGVFTTLTEVETNIAWGTNVQARKNELKVNGTGAQVDIEVWVDGVKRVTYADTSADRILTGSYCGVYAERGWSNNDGQPFWADLHAGLSSLATPGTAGIGAAPYRIFAPKVA